MLPPGVLGRLYNADLSQKAKPLPFAMPLSNGIASAGYTPMIYANKSMLTNDIDGEALGGKRYDLVGELHYRYDIWRPYQFWQYRRAAALTVFPAMWTAIFILITAGAFMPFRDVAVGSWFYDDIALCLPKRYYGRRQRYNIRLP